MKTFTKEQLNPWWAYKCQGCGHVDTTEHCDGGRQNYTGDYDDCYCPKCGHTLEDDAVEGVDYRIEGVEYFECQECGKESVTRTHSKRSPSIVTQTFYCHNCEEENTFSA